MRRRFTPPAIPSSEITDETAYFRRRDILRAAGVAATFPVAGSLALPAGATVRTGGTPLEYRKAVPGPDGFYTDETPTPFEDIAAYCNFYEFGTDKGDPAKNAHTLVTDPWSVEVTGHADRTGVFALEELVDSSALEERIYRLRCVEAWSMVVPWVGIPLASVLKKLGPTSKAEFVRFETLADPRQMPGVRSPVLDWPYVEGLRMDEAMNPLTLMAVGVYGKPLPGQNGAPIRLVVPWKYGFKSIKSIVKISLVEEMPMTSWWKQNLREYGFYSNVNPKVDHPRWSQARERRIGDFFKRETLMFNGYEDEVASMYAGMDLEKYF